MPDGGTDPLTAAGHTIVAASDDDLPLTHEQLCAAVADVDAVVCLLTDKIDEAVIAAGTPRLKVVANVAVGYDNVDVRAAPRPAWPCATRPVSSTRRPPTSRSC